MAADHLAITKIAAAALAAGGLLLSAGETAQSTPPALFDPAAIRTGFDLRMVPREPAFTVARVRDGRSVALRREPGGDAFGRLGPRTEFGSPTRLAVTRRRGHWLGVESPLVANGKLAWVDGRGPALARARVRVSLRVDLSKRRLTLFDGTRAVRHLQVGIGRPASPTPTGRFAVTDKLPGRRFSAAYGCCILALSGHQTHTPPGWRGGDRLAIHGGSLGDASAGCLHAAEADLRVLMRRVPLGTPVFVRR